MEGVGFGTLQPPPTMSGANHAPNGAAGREGTTIPDHAGVMEVKEKERGVMDFTGHQVRGGENGNRLPQNELTTHEYARQEGKAEGTEREPSETNTNSIPNHNEEEEEGEGETLRGEENKAKERGKAAATDQLGPYYRYRWLPSRRARANTIQLMEMQQLQHIFEEKDFAEMEREEIKVQEKPRKASTAPSTTLLSAGTTTAPTTMTPPSAYDQRKARREGLSDDEGSSGEEAEKEGRTGQAITTGIADGSSNKTKRKQSQKGKGKGKKEEGAPVVKRRPMDITKLQERLAQAGDKPLPTVVVDPITGEKKRLLKCALCMAYNSLKVCTKGMCSRCCPVGGNPCPAHAQRQRKLDALKESLGGGGVTQSPQPFGSPQAMMSTVSTTVMTGTPSPSPQGLPEQARKYKKRKSSDAESLKKLGPHSSEEGDRSKKRRTDSPSEAVPQLPSPFPVPSPISSSGPMPGSLSGLQGPSLIDIGESPSVAPAQGDSGAVVVATEGGDTDNPDQISSRKCSLCHSNNYMKLCPKEMCRVCCPKDGVPCTSHIFKETLKKNAEELKTRREERPVKLDKNGRRIPLKCAQCTAYNAMKDCTRDLCSVCCRKDPRGMCAAHAFISNKMQKLSEANGEKAATATSPGAASPRSYTERRKLKKMSKPSDERQDESVRPDNSGPGGNGDESNMNTDEATQSSRQPAKRRWTEMAKAEVKEKGDEQGEGDQEANGGEVMESIDDLNFGASKRRTPSRCSDCNSNNALRLCSKGMCSLCCPKGGAPCSAHLTRQGTDPYDIAGDASLVIEKMEDAQAETDRNRPLKKRYVVDDSRPAPSDALLALESKIAAGLPVATTNGAKPLIFKEEEKPTRHQPLKCVDCNSYNMLKTCANGMCSVCCSRSRHGPCAAHMKRTGDAAAEVKTVSRGRPGRKPKSAQPTIPASVYSEQVHTSRRAKQNTLARIRLQQLQDEFDSGDDDSDLSSESFSSDLSELSDDEEDTLVPSTNSIRPEVAVPSNGSLQSPRAYGAAEAEARRNREREKEREKPKGGRATTKEQKEKGKEKVKYEPEEEEEEEEEVMGYPEMDVGSDYEQEFVDDLQFITCEKRPSNGTLFKRPLKIEEPTATSTYSTQPQTATTAHNTFTTTNRILSPTVRTHGTPYKKKGDMRCANCKSTKAGIWRDGWIPEGDTTPVTLCNACGIRYNKDMFCSYCNYIYQADEDWETTKWIGCDMCNKWIHRKCEEKRLGFSVDQSDLYLCPHCRVKHSRYSSGEVLSEKMKRDQARRQKRKQRKLLRKQERNNHDTYDETPVVGAMA